MPNTEQSPARQWQAQVATGETRDAVTLLADLSGLSRSAIKQAMIKGAVWLKRRRQEQRLRRATAKLQAGDHLSFYYDADILGVPVPAAECLQDLGRYSVWNKPPGMLAQGTRYGDHCSLLRVAEQYFQPARQALLVHRLDRETSGLMVIAHQPHTAAALSQQLQDGSLFKCYLAQVKGAVREPLWIDSPIEGQSATTEVLPVRYDEQRNQTLVAVRLLSGRKHQIRRHLADARFPVMGDPQYGSHNSNTTGLALHAHAIALHCPVIRQPLRWRAPWPAWLTPDDALSDAIGEALRTLFDHHTSGKRN